MKPFRDKPFSLKSGGTKRILSVPVFLGFVVLAGAQTIVPGGEVSGIWNSDGSPYRITGDIVIPHDSALFIEPGVMVEFQGHFHLKVMGRLLAEGTVNDTILFTVNDTTGFADPDTSLGGWYGIRICDIQEANDTTRLSFCKFQYGKAVGPGWFLNAGGALCVIDFDRVVVSNCVFTHNSAGGPAEGIPSGGAIYLSRSDIRLVNNTFIHNRAVDGGAIHMFECNPVFMNNVISDNHCTQHGGGIAGTGASNPSFSGDAIIHNNAGSHGGGIMLWGPGEASFDSIKVIRNSAEWGGGLGFAEFEAQLLNSVISSNRAASLGGGMAADGSDLTIMNTLFENDSSFAQSGAIHTWQGKLHIHDCTFNGNFSETGGAVHTAFSTLEIGRSSFTNNTAQEGGALQVYNSHLQMDSCLFDANEASVDGGALDYAADSLVFDSLYDVRIRNSQLINNTAGRAAGGFSIQQSHTEKALIDLQVDRCRIIGNRARQVAGFRIMRCVQGITLSNSMVSGNRAEAWTGGGTLNAGSVGTVLNCIFFDNQSATIHTDASGGGFGVGNGARASIHHCAFVKNSAGRCGGLTVHRGAEAVMMNSIVWNNFPDEIALISTADSTPSMLTLYYNDIRYGEDSIQILDSISILNFGNGNLDLDPLFVDEASGDLHLQDESPVIGAGIDSMEIKGTWYFSPPADMEGNPRPDPDGSKPDMGAYENRRSWALWRHDHTVYGKDRLDLKAYPNPFSDEIFLEFFLAKSSQVTIRAFDMVGAEVAIPLSVFMDPGIQRIRWKPEHESDQIYFIQIRAVPAGGEVVQETTRILRSR
mgnify:CR=1 FL=1